MIRATKPDSECVERYLLDCQSTEPTFASPGNVPAGFSTVAVSADLGAGDSTFEDARSALVQWKVHHRAGVIPHPATPPLEPGTTVALVTRQLGLWILAACRITSVVDSASEFGFTYTTLPDHPECGEESFTTRRLSDGTVVFEIAATWRSAALIARVGAPVATVLQRRATQRYLDAMVTACAATQPNG